MPGEPKDSNNTICKLYKLFVSESDYNQFVAKLEQGLAWGEAKKELFAVMNAYIAPMREKFNYYQSNRKEVDEILNQGAIKARQIATARLNKVKKAIGIKN
jgi:tryptophanyl-tRNA synthetase